MGRSKEFVQEAEGGATLHLVIVPGASSTEVDGVDAWRDALRIRVAARARDGEANTELVRFLAEVLSAPSKEIVIIRGTKAHRKDVFVPLAAETVRTRLGLR